MTDDGLRVLHLIKGLGPGGAERLVVTQSTSSVSNVYAVAYLLAEKSHLVPELEEHGIKVRCLGSGRSRARGWTWRLRRLLRKDPFDVVHVHSPLVAAWTRLIVKTMRRRHRPVVVGTEHNRWPRHHHLTRWANRLTIGLQDATIAVSADIRSTMSRTASARTEVVVHGIDLAAVRATADRDRARHELGVGPGDVLGICIANLRREKALDVLIAAAAEATGIDERLHYAVIGQGPLADELAGEVAERGLGHRFRLLGYRTDATMLLSGADFFTLSSRHEGLPVAIMEALALGVPVVATAAGGVPTAIGMAGVTVPVDDAAALARAHVEIAGDERARAELASIAAAEAERYGAARATIAIEAVYAEALTRARGERAASSHS